MKQYLLKLIDGNTLTQEETHQIMLNIVKEQYNVQQVAALLMAMQIRGVTVDELLGFRQGLLETGKYLDFSDYNTLDIVGTGGDGKNTFNISTCSAFVIAGAGYKVTKHGNGGSSSVSGASNVLQGHGVKFTDDIDHLKRSLEETGICYFHAPLFAYGMKFVGPTRKALTIPTCFNLLGPLVNPCHPKNSLHGTANQSQLRLYTNLHQRIGDNFGVITSYDGYDEISLTSGFKICTNNFEKVLTPVDLGLKYIEQSDIYGGETPEDAMKIFDAVLEGTSTEAQKNVVIANAACGISIMDRNISMADSVAMARESLESGKALQVFKKFVEVNS
ncbi:MAG: anthranilate phosphoribosyltransferase [Bacteroidaceae bacterium]|nr:anthranilate phosphoribosyltransferase [Prevotellaceae bacterium]MDD7527488.1 anthranilate phosphoribosyltransferase [Prevotellaceae bacterium]MDY5760204.1 anthranilate phosphoribosyltransferase [Bacteroidaceae bacterium]